MADERLGGQVNRIVVVVAAEPEGRSLIVAGRIIHRGATITVGGGEQTSDIVRAMMVGTKGSVFGLLKWQWKNTLLFVSSAAVVVALRELVGWDWLDLPALPLGVVGGALGIFVSFRTNSAYDRWWEGRKLWGRMINSSRHWGTQVMSYLKRGRDGEASAHQRALILRHAAYVHVLRCLLRGQDPFEDSDVMVHLERDPSLRDETNLTHALLQRQLDDATRFSEEEHFDEFRLSNLDLTIRQLLDIQGGCERIKKTPMPRGYGFIAERLIQYFSVLFPLTIASEIGWWTVPINLLVCMAFALISEAGRVLEDPFTMFFNGLPLMAISRMIEVNLRQRLGEPRAELPPLLEPDPRGILM